MMSNKEFKHWLDMIFDCACSDKTFIGLETAKRIKARTIQLLELDTPKKPVFDTNKIIHSMGFFCPACQTRVNRGEHKYFCKCGQRLDWGEE